MHRVVQTVFILSIAFFVSPPSWAQSGSGNGAVEGAVVDAESKPVPGASIEIRAVDTGEVRRVVTDARGRFTALAMPVGVYTVEATLTGFAPSRRNGVTVTVGRVQMVELQLAVAGVSEVVTVEAPAALDKTLPATAAHIGLDSIGDLPVRGRKFTEFVLLTPGVVQESDRFGVVIGGQRSINSNISLDGADFNDPLQGNQRGGNESSFFFPQGAVREFQVVRNGAGAETGRTSAGFVNVVTKSGTNTFHGEGLYLNRNKHLTSANAFDQKLDNKQHQFGAAFGGPLAKDRAFFFGSAEQNFLRVPFLVKFQAQAAGVRVPAEILALEGEKFGTDNPTATFGRVDWHASPRNRVDLQYMYTRLAGKNSNFESPQLDVAEDGNFSRQMKSHAVKTGLVTVATAVVNEFRVQVATDDRIELPNVPVPAVVISGFGTIGGDGDRPRFFDARRFQVSDSTTALRGRHELRAGIDLNVTPSRQQHEGRIVGRYDFTSLANYNARVISRYRQTVPSSNPDEQFYKGTQRELALFVQDKITLSSNVTLSAGVRWEGQWNPQPPRPNTAIPVTTRVPNDLAMWQPRVGLTWDATGAGRTIVRINGGLYNARTPATIFARVFTDNGATVVNIDSRNDPTILALLPFPNGLKALPLGVRVPLQRVYGISPDFQNPDTTAASATVEHRVNDAIALSIGYAHNRTIHLHRRLDKNLFPPTIAPTGMPIFPATRPNPAIAQLEVNESTAKSQYDGLILTANGRRDAVQWDLSYTYAKNWDDDSNERVISRQMALNPFDLAAEWAPSKNDVRHALTASALAPLPGGVTIAGILLARSGVPYSATIGTDTQNDLNDNNDRAIINGRVVGRNSFRQPSFFNLDLRVLKAFRFAGTRELQLLVDVLNATRASNKNLANDAVSVFGTPANPVASAGQMLYAPSTARFGGPRQVQLGMKVVF